MLWKGLPEAFPNATYVEFERSSHYPMYEERERFDAELRVWMDRNGIGWAPSGKGLEKWATR